MWYLIMPSAELKKAKTQRLVLNEKGIVLGRNNQGVAFALKDVCPHRAVPLSQGSYDGEQIECCYHGWCFNSEGQCTKIPALGPDTELDSTSIQVLSYPVIERYGAIWLYYHESHKAENPDMSSLPELPLADDQSLRLVSHHELQCDMDNAVIGLIDPSHVPSVHGSWLWRSKHQLKKKEKEYSAYRRGFIMKKHERKFGGVLSKILSKPSSTEISFQLPGIRVEEIKYGNKKMLIVLALYPVNHELTILRQYSFTDLALIKAFYPALKIYGTRFLEEDVEVVRKQSLGLAENPKTMLVGDADLLAIWYYNLKEEHLRANETNTEFENPIEDSKLVWWT